MSRIAPVDLRFDKHIPPNGSETENPLVIMHGLLSVSDFPVIYANT